MGSQTPKGKGKERRTMKNKIALMKEKTSVTLSPEVLAGIDRLAEARDLAILNDAADRLNQEAADVLDYQAADE
jgi:hypothetical protein